MMSKFPLLLLLLLFPCTTIAQEAAAISAAAAYLAGQLPENEDLSALTGRLTHYVEHPAELNSTTPEQLNELGLLSPLQIASLFSYRRQSGRFLDLLELQAIPGFDPEIIRVLLPFVTLKTERTYDELTRKRLTAGNHELLLRYGRVLEKQKGYLPLPGSRYMGSPDRLLLKYRYRLDGLLDFSLTGKKDAGETFFGAGSKQGFDFLSASLTLYGKGKLKKLLLGDYSMQSGQGLALWSGGPALGKGPDVAGVAKKETGLSGYHSTSETDFLRGIAVNYNLLKNIDLNSFISYKKLDASIKTSAEGRKELTGFSSSGLHRTPAEIRNKGQLAQLVYGTEMNYRRRQFSAGLLAYHSAYSYPFITGTPLYRQYDFTGKTLSNFALHYSYTYKNCYFFGETARSEPGGIAALNGMMASLSRAWTAVLTLRSFSRTYHSFYSQAAGEHPDAANENGIYLGAGYSPDRRWLFAVYADLYAFPWAGYRIDRTSSGYELMGKMVFSPQKSLKLTVQLKNKRAEQNLGSGLPLNPVVKVWKQQARLQLDGQAGRNFSLQSRAEVAVYRKGEPAAEYGYMVYQDAAYNPPSAAIDGSIRLAWIHTPSYHSRIYAYEDDVLYGAGSGSYSGKGIRTVGNLGYRPGRQWKIWIRYALLLLPGTAFSGSGLEEITGGKKSDLKVQLRYKF